MRIQIRGRGVCNIHCKVFLYADKMTRSIEGALAETDRRRAIQAEYNRTHGIIPQSARSEIQPSLAGAESTDPVAAALPEHVPPRPADQKDLPRYVDQLKQLMFDAAAKREYERAAQLRDAVRAIQQHMLTSQ